MDPHQQQQQNEVQTFALNINTNGANSAFTTQGNAFPLTIDPQTNAITVGANYAAAINRTASQQSLVQNAMPVNLQPSMANMANVILAPSHQLNHHHHQQIPTVQMNGFQQQLLPFQLGANVITTASPFVQTQTATQQVRPEYEASKTQQIVQQAIVQNNLATQGNKILIPANRKQALPRLGK